LLAKFPKNEKYTLGQTIEQTTLDIIKDIFSCATPDAIIRKNHLNLASIQLDLLKLLIRLAYDIKVINQRAYIRTQTLLQEIGRMLGGWLRSLKD
jgi:hypothetical protein